MDYYGTPTPLNQVANLHVPEPALITIQPWDVSQIGAIEKAIRVSDLGLNPSNDGKIVRLPIPPLTEEQRERVRDVVRAELGKKKLSESRADAIADAVYHELSVKPAMSGDDGLAPAPARD